MARNDGGGGSRSREARDTGSSQPSNKHDDDAVPHTKQGLGSAEKHHLDLSEIRVSQRMARALPAELAFRYHALPVAREGGRFTVAMAHPEDGEACKAISTALGDEPIFVRGESRAIDDWLTKVWYNVQGHRTQVVACLAEDQSKEEIGDYAESLSTAISGNLRWMRRPKDIDALSEAITSEAGRGVVDLVLLRETRPLGARLLRWHEAEGWAARRLPASLLILREPSWPIRRLLLILRCDAADNAALDWVVRIARPSGAEVVVLTLVPPIPSVYNGLERMEHRLSEVLATDTSLGKQLRDVARTFVDWEINATLRLRQGVPEWEIKHELAEGEYDLVVVAGESDRGILGRAVPGAVGPVLACACCPVLIARPGTACS